MAENPPLKMLVEPPIGWLVVDRRATRGALTYEMWKSLPGMLRELAGRDGVRVVVIRGSAGHFIAGADISEFQRFRSDPDLARRYDEGADETLDALADLAVPSVAMIEGACMGGGCLIAFGCDLRVAARSARFGVPAGRLGLAYPYKGLERMVALLGETHSLELLLTGRTVTADEAKSKGMVSDCFEPDALEAETRRLATDIAANAPLALRYARQATRRAGHARISPERIAELAAACFASADYAEGIAAFLEKRAPRFRGR